ncbi:MAG: ATP-binding protein [Nocardioides sp.]
MLREARIARGLSLTGLAEVVHYSRGYLSKVETGSSRANPSLARRCDDALGMGGRLVELVPPRAPGGSRVAAAGARVVWTVPAVTRHFSGRAVELREVSSLLTAVGTEGGAEGQRLVVVHGMPGVGKTALSLEVAHRVREWFPDGCVFLDLSGHEVGLPVAVALDALLRQAGVDGQEIAADLSGRAAQWRGLLARRRMLIVLDNAASASQVNGLAPGAGGCAVVVTSRRRLSALDEASHVALAPLPSADAVALFTRTVGSDKLGGADMAGPEYGPTLEVVRQCGGLPLAIRIAAARCRGGSGLSVAELADRLSDETGRLVELDDGERAAAAVFDHAYRGLPKTLRTMFGLLVLPGGVDISAAAGAALAGRASRSAERDLEYLVDVGLLQSQAGGRYGFHDLVRLFANRVAARDLGRSDQDTAVASLASYYLKAVTTADTVLIPRRHRPRRPAERRRGSLGDLAFVDTVEASTWLAGESLNVAAMSRACVAHGQHQKAWQLAYALRGYLFWSRSWDALVGIHSVGLTAAYACGDVWAQATMLDNLGRALVRLDRLDEADAAFSDAFELFTEIGDRYGQHTVRNDQSWVDHRRGNYLAAVAAQATAQAFYGSTGAERNAAVAMRDRALTELALGRRDQAVEHLRSSVVAMTRLGLWLDAATALNCLGEVMLGTGDTATSLSCHSRALTLARRCGNRHEQARAHLGRAAAETANGREALARHHRRAAADLDLIQVEHVNRWLPAPLVTTTPD